MTRRSALSTLLLAACAGALFPACTRSPANRDESAPRQETKATQQATSVEVTYYYLPG